MANHLCPVISASWLCSCGIRLPGALSSFHDSLTCARGQEGSAERRPWLIHADVEPVPPPLPSAALSCQLFLPSQGCKHGMGHWPQSHSICSRACSSDLWWEEGGQRWRHSSGPPFFFFFFSLFLFPIPFVIKKKKCRPSKEGLLDSSAVVWNLHGEVLISGGRELFCDWSGTV